MKHSRPKTDYGQRLPIPIKDTYYGILGLQPSASAADIRRAYRNLSKLYHPDTTQLDELEATAKFQALNEAYATLSNPQRRVCYDATIRYRPAIAATGRPPKPAPPPPSAAYLDPRDRPLSAGEALVLFGLLAILFGCLALAVAIALLRGDPLVT